jgi:outer membrane receptor protein involved in Fe transport
MTKLFNSSVVMVCICLLLMPCWLWAQTSGQITGQVLDSSQAAIPQVKVTAENVANAQRREVMTDNSGYYTIANLPIGTYNLTAEHGGFQTQVKTGVTVDVARTVPLNFVLPVSQVVQRVEVVAEIPVLETGGATTGSTMGNQQIGELPINGRDYARFSLLVPGAVARSNYIADLSFDGLHTVHNQFSIDGIDASRVDQPYMSNGYERGARLLTGSLDTISEFRVQTSDYQAEFGRAAGSVINIATKSGTKNFHGTMFEFFRNDRLDAKNFFATAKPPFRFNDFGGNIGGPIQKDKTFFFINYEGSRQRIGIVGTGTVPSPLLLSQVQATSPQLAPILAVMPTTGITATTNPLVDSYTVAQVSDVREDTGSIRVDHTFSEKDTAFARINVNDSHVFGPLYGVTSSGLGATDFQNVPVRTTNIALHESHVFSPRLINEFLMGMQRWGSQIISDEPIPQTTIVGLTAVVGTRGRSLENATSFQWGDNLTKTIGRHTLKWGGNIYRVQVNRDNINTSSMQFNSLNDFINDRLASVSLTAGDPGHGTRATQFGAFIQDTFRIRPTLTLDYGLRYDFETVPHDGFNATQTYDIHTQTLAPAGTAYFQANTTDFGPRFGLAWSPTSRIVVRTGYGLFWQAYPVGFASYYVPLNTIPGNTTLLQAQIANLSFPFTQFVSQGSHPLRTVYGFDPVRGDLYSGQWNLSVGTQLTPNTAFQVAYVGNHGMNLRRNMNINFYDPTLGRRPNPNFADINIEGNTGQSIYHALQVSLKRRMAAGLLFDAEYTYSHTIDDVQDQGIWSAQPQDDNNLKAERGNGSGDIRHNFAFNLLYDIPMGQGHQFLGNTPGFAEKIVSGWRMAILGIMHTGIADTVYIGTNTYGNANYTNQRPNCVAGVDPYPANQTIKNWLNPAAFSMPASGTFGNCGRNTIFGPGFNQIDFSMLKETKVGEGRTLEFRAEFFDVLNHPNFAQPNTTFGTGAFGQVFSTFGSTIGIGTSRQIQMSLKFNF